MIQTLAQVSVVVRSSEKKSHINSEIDLQDVFAKLEKKWERNPRILRTTLDSLTRESPFGLEIDSSVLNDMIAFGIFCRKCRCLTCDRDQLRMLLNA